MQAACHSPVPEIIDPVFVKTSQNARFLLSENERFGLVFVKTGSINSGTVGFFFKFMQPTVLGEKGKATRIYSRLKRYYLDL